MLPQPDFNKLSQLIMGVSAELSRLPNMPGVAESEQVLHQLQQMNVQMAERHNDAQQQLQGIQQELQGIRQQLQAIREGLALYIWPHILYY
ncbi:hypothetical protein BJV78DRAFT_1246960 [Lactifluus subvellereus]|nr:hypothetical protein BJV78DRAFT_1246960 [Lactifluus subvellereus]